MESLSTSTLSHCHSPSAPQAISHSIQFYNQLIIPTAKKEKNLAIFSYHHLDLSCSSVHENPVFSSKTAEKYVFIYFYGFMTIKCIL